MASYVYNPSQKVTELLSHYLEFDAKQLQVGIWSGHLRLKDVHLKASAVDQFLKLPYSSISFQLVSGTIGLLDLQIPWKQLVLGQSDVRVKLQDVVLVIQVKPQDDLFQQQEEGNNYQQDQYEAGGISRAKKQKRLLEAERRTLQGRPLGPWLRSVKKRDNEDSANSQAEEPVILEQKNWISKRLTSAINDFFWRFFAGLKMDLNHLKVVLVQDGVEVGVSVPSFTINRREAAPQQNEPQSFGNKNHSKFGSFAEYQSEEGEHVNKQVKVSQFGLFIRKAVPLDDNGLRAVVTMKEFILCPMDVDFGFSLFYPYPLEKRQRRKALRNEAHFHGPQGSAQDELSSTSSPSPKKRRAKREKIEGQSMSTADLTIDHFSNQGQSLFPLMKPQSFRPSSSIMEKPSTVSRHVTVTLPLAQPQNVKSNVARDQTGEHARLEGHLKIAMVNFKFSTRHCHLLGKLIKSAIRRRNGRPDQRIRSAIRRREQQDEEDDESVDREVTKSVIRLWWTYAITSVVREVRKRRKVRKKFQDRFLSFMWDRQKHKRSEYVRLYIDHRLRQHLLVRNEEDLLRIEDELCIEQILLYRAIARKIHVRGGTQMPTSMLDLAAHDNVQSADLRRSTTSNMSMSSDDHRSVRYDSGPLGSLEEQCEMIRLRKEDVNNFSFEYQSNETFLGWTEFEKGGDGEDMSFITLTTAATGTTIAPSDTPLDNGHPLFLSFSTQVDCLEIAIIKEELFYDEDFQPSLQEDLSNCSVSSKFVSDLSILTEERQWDNSSQHSSEENNPLDPSDFLIFGVPGKVLLRMRLQQTNLSLVSADTGKIVFSIAHIAAFGDQDSALFAMGNRSASGQSQEHALYSWVELPKNGAAPAVQVDADRVMLWAHFESLHQLDEFLANCKNLLPRPLLKTSAREEVRLYILKESSQSSWSRVHVSIRVHGAEIALGQCTLRLDMFELYSGSSIPKDCTDERQPTGSVVYEAARMPTSGFHTRTLRLITGDDLATPCSPWSHRWVFAVSGTDLTASREDGKMFEFLESPFDAEVLCTFNSNTCFDINQVKVKALIKISPVQWFISEERLKLLLSSLPTPPPAPPASNVPPRLEVLSRFVVLAAEVSVQRCQVKILCDDESGIDFESSETTRIDYLERFLGSMSCFDVTFPHNEALISTMQICIERLAGTGMPAETAWLAVNAALQHFLDQTANLAHEDLDLSSNSEHCMESAIRQATDSTLNDFSILREASESKCLRPQDFVLDFAHGFKITAVQLFYDSYMQISVPCLFCANGEGVHVMRLASNTDSLKDDNENQSMLPSSENGIGFVFKRFLVDKGHSFGRGGSPLSVLKSDKDEAHDVGNGTLERLDSCQLGDVELLCTRKLTQDFSRLLSALVLPLESKNETVTDNSLKMRDRHLCMAVMSASLLAATDELVPFSRLALTRFHLCSGESFSLRSEGLDIINLSPESESHSVIVSALDDDDLFKRERDPPFFLQISGSHTHIIICCARIVFLQKYFQEVRQILLSPDYGILSLFQDLRDARSVTPPESSLFSFRLDLKDSSLLVPRSSASSDMLAIESEVITISASYVDASFLMPDGLSELQLDPVETSGNGPRVPRTKIEVRGARIFSSLSEVSSGDAADHPSFHCYYKMGGRAARDEVVYVNRANHGEFTLPIEAAEEFFSEVQRVWRELSIEPIAIDIIVDQAPQLRILLTNPGSDAGVISLDMRTSQFCLLLSIWYSNMQELPSMFPYAPVHVKSAAELPVEAHQFPTFGTEEMKELLLNPSRVTSEVCVVYATLSVRFTFDCYDNEGRLLKESTGCTLCLKETALRFTKDDAGVGRCGFASSTVTLEDENYSPPDFLLVSCGSQSKPWANMQFGLMEKYRTLSTGLAQPFQMSIFITPSWTMFNVGVDGAKLLLTDLGPVYRFLEFATAYVTDEQHGNPSFEVARVVRELKESLTVSVGTPDDLPRYAKGCGGTDFRLWMTSPSISIPCVPSGSVNIHGDGGIWFHYTSTGGFSSQEVVTGGLSMKFEEGRNREQKLIDNLSFGMRVDHNFQSNHSDYSIQVPFTDPLACRAVSPSIAVAPIVIAEPSVCTPTDQPSRYLGPQVCEITCIFEVLPLVTSAIFGLFTPREGTVSEDIPEKIGSFAAEISDIRLFLLDPVLRNHLPIFVVSLSSLNVTISQFSSSQSTRHIRQSSNIESIPDDLNVIVACHLFADYFKLGTTRSWEPLLEAYKFCLLWERDKSRGGGLTLSSDSPLHANISSAFLVIISQVFGFFKQQFREGFGFGSLPAVDTTAVSGKDANEAKYMLRDVIEGFPLIHRKTIDVDIADRVAFSLKNMTGQRIRLYDTEPSPILTYLDHSHVVKLSFEASVTSVQNLTLKEVNYPGFDEVSKEVVPHAVDIQLPGCYWIQGLKVDSFGRSFAAVEPKSAALQKRLNEDWRLRNLMKVLIEIGFEKGGRQVAVRSLFEVVNRTSHSIRVICHPNPSCSSRIEQTAGVDIANESHLVEPGDAFNVPTLLILDAMKRDIGCTGSTGSFWVKPETLPNDIARSFVGPDGGHESASNFEVHFSSRGVHFSKLVEESASIFKKARGEDVSPDDAISAVQLACPLVQDGDRMAPFCYAVEVGRSPIVGTVASVRKDLLAHGPVLYNISIHPPFVVVNLLPKKGRFELMHAVHRRVLWFEDIEPGEEVCVHSLGLDSPLLLLIKLGYCRTPVGGGALVHHGTEHSSRLRVPFAENLVGFKSIGKAGKAVTKQIGKTLTAIGDSPDKRAQNKLFKAQNPNLKNEFSKDKQARVEIANDKREGSSGVADGKTYRVDSSSYSPQDVAESTTVVDGIGQKLTLKIDNIRGGGGQRRIAIYSPYWIINTTELPLRYKQENSKVFVSGTVHSPDHDGSKSMFSNISCEKRRTPRNRQNNDCAGEDDKSRPIFSGTPGALSAKSRRLPKNEIAELLDADLPLKRMEDLAFMFNFHEVLGMAVPRFCIQLGDGTGTVRYQSDWSKGLALDPVGISQVANMHCKDGRFLDVAVVVHVAPEILSNYTTIVRILPRYVFANMLGYPVRLWQDSSIFHPLSSQEGNAAQGEIRWKLKQQPSEKNNLYENLWGKEAALDDDLDGKMPLLTTATQSATYISTIDSSDLVPFVLPDTRGDRILRLDFGGSYKLTASVSVDAVGEHILPLTRNVDLKMIRHVSTRASPEYQVSLIAGVQGFTGELGVWFETEWGNSRKVIVKTVKKPSFAFDETEIHVGDELLKIDGIPVTRYTFATTMRMLRSRLNEVSQYQDTGRSVLRRASMRLGGTLAARESQSVRSSCRPLELVFRTMEERLRRVRMKAAKANAMTHCTTTSPLPLDNMGSDHLQSAPETSLKYVRVELKSVHHMTFVVLHSEDSPPFSIRNQTFATTIYFRQKNCTAHSWLSLKPGKTCSYAWQEPLKPKRLSVRVAPATSYSLFDERDNGQVRINKNNHGIQNEEDAYFSQTISVRLEDIGSTEIFHWQDKRTSLSRWLEFQVDVVGTTRVLVARDSSSQEGDLPLRWKLHIDSLQEAICEESERSRSLVALNDKILTRVTSDEISKFQGQSSNALAEEASSMMSDLSKTSIITRRHQVLVEVLEATGLSSDSFAGACNPYVQIKMKHGKSIRRSLFKKTDLKRTYYVRKSFCPTWESQAFVFDVSQDAVDNPRVNALSILVKSYRRFGHHKVLGAAQIDLHSLRNQEPLVGWFPLTGRTGHRELENQLSHWGRGSIRIRAQYVFSVPGLVQYFILLSERRLIELKERKDDLAEQLNQSSDDEERKMSSSDDGPRNLLSNPSSDLVSATGTIAQRGLSMVKKLVPLRPLRSNLETILATSHPKQYYQNEQASDQSLSYRRPYPAIGELKSIRIGTFAMPLLTHNLEDTIKQQQREFQPEPMRSRNERITLSGGLEGTKLDPSFVRSWTMAQHIYNNDDLCFRFEDSQLNVLLNPNRSPTFKEPAAVHSEKRAMAFEKSRNSFEQSTKRSLSTILNKGGYLTIRPITALNLPDTYTGMFVKVRYGQQVIVTKTVDARVTPIWSDRASIQSSTGTKDATYQSNDIRIRVHPQESSGWIRLSVMGERKQKQLQGKTEIGTVYLPLEKLLAACANERVTCVEGSMYERWFPLLSPEEATPVEGTGGLIPQPPEVEQVEESKFKDVYRPRIQLAVTWVGDENDVKNSSERRTVRTAASTVKFYVKADISRLSAALLDSERSLELLSFNIMDIDARYWVTDVKTRLCLSASWAQIDNQAENAREAIALAPTPSDFFVPVIQVFAMKDNLRSSEVVSFDLIDVSVAEFDVTIEEQLVCDLLIFLYSLRLRDTSRTTTGSEEAERIDDGLGSRTEDPPIAWLLKNGFNISQASQRIYVQRLVLGVIKFNLSYVKGNRNTWELTRRPAELLYKQLEDVVHRFSHHTASDMLTTWSRKTSSEDKLEQDKGFQTLPKKVASLFPNVSDAPIRLQAKTSQHIFKSPSEILHDIRKLYAGETMKQIYKIIGSLDFVGNPTMLVSSVVTGFKDLLLAPSTAFLKSPTDPSVVGVSVAKGTLSLFSHSTSGFFAFCTKVSATTAQFVANLSLDSSFSDRHREEIVGEATSIQRHWKKRGTQNVGHSLVRPVIDIAAGVTHGVCGLFTAPVNGLQKGGMPGLLLGVTTGVTGVVTRPIVGVLDAISHISASVHDIARSVNMLEKRFQPALRVRLPYTFGFMNILIPFDSSLSRATALIKRYPLRRRKRSAPIPEEVVVHVEVLPDSAGDDTFAILTNVRVILVKLKKGVSGHLASFLCWEFHLDEKTDISSEVVDHGHSGIALTIKLKKSNGKAAPRKALSSPELIKLHSRIIRKRTQPLSPKYGENAKKFELEQEQDDAPEGQEDERIEEGGEENVPEEEDLEVDTDDFDHYTKMDTEGEIFECFSILAEYQFRRQLGRLHNALCCILGNFDSIRRDPDFGPHGSQSHEGYTSFGIYHFSQDSQSSDTFEHRLPRVLENLPWVTDSLFETYSDMLWSEQQEAVFRERQSMDHSARLRASAKEGGSEWLIHARAWALSLEKEGDEDVDLQSYCDNTGSQRGEGWGSNVDLFSSARATLGEARDYDEKESQESHSCSRIVDEDDASGDVESSGFVEIPADFQPDRFETHDDSSTSMDQSFGSSFATANEEIVHVTTCDSVESQGIHAGMMMRNDEGCDSGLSESVYNDTKNFAGTSPNTRHERSNTMSASVDPADRLDRLHRMESLMEQLITFSAEQAVMRERQVTQTGSLDFALLRQEIGELKDELRKNSAAESASEEVAKLREEVARLKSRIDQKDHGIEQKSPSLRGKRGNPLSLRSWSTIKDTDRDQHVQREKDVE